jgi:hypothetical protein
MSYPIADATATDAIQRDRLGSELNSAHIEAVYDALLCGGEPGAGKGNVLWYQRFAGAHTGVPSVSTAGRNRRSRMRGR